MKSSQAIATVRRTYSEFPLSLSAAKVRVCWTACLLFLMLKIPALFMLNHAEELRDYADFVSVSEGQKPYKDFVYIYGPLPPLLYGAILKVLPHRLITIRIVSLSFWLVAVVFLALIFSRYLAPLPSIVGTLFAASVVGYPSYCHNHVLAAVATIISGYFLLDYIEKRKGRSLSISFLFVLVCVFARPVPMGFILPAWFAISFVHRGTHWRAQMVRCGIIFLAVTLFFFLVYGLYIQIGLVPRVYLDKTAFGYPNVGYLMPSFAVLFRHAYAFARECRAAIDTLLFYLQYFIWPTFIVTAAYLSPKRRTIRAAAVLSVLGLSTSLDVLHYGGTDPLQGQAFFVRKQFFFSLTLVSFFLVGYPLFANVKRKLFPKITLCLSMMTLVLWGHIPLFVGIYQLSKFPVNERNLSIMRGIVTHPDFGGLYEAVEFVNSFCTEKDWVVVGFYQPSLLPHLRCQDAFGKDRFAFGRWPRYEFSPRENPYHPEGGVTSSAYLTNRLEATNPRFLILPWNADLGNRCSESSWQSKWFGTLPNKVRVCYRVG